MLNGRGPSNCTYTSISSKGLAVVDYCIVPVEFYSHFSEFKVEEMFQLADNLNVNIPTKLPDHSLLSWSLHLLTSPIVHSPSEATCNKKVFRKMPECYMHSQDVHFEINSLIQQLETASSKEDLNMVYNSFCQVLDSELITFVPSKKRRKHKVWWNNTLTLLRKSVCLSRKAWINNKSNKTNKSLYLKAQKLFDKEVAEAKSNFYKEQQNSLINSLSKKPRQFWKKIQDLGITTARQNSKTLPSTLLNPDGSEISDKQEVLGTWKSYFDNLFNPNIPTQSPDSVESGTDDLPFSPELSMLNEPFTEQEVELAIQNINTKSAPGPDEIKVPFIQNKICSSFLGILFNKCLSLGVVPCPWQQSIIKPIPKPGGNSIDPNDYRGISLQSVVTKVLCYIMNSRLCEYLEHLNLLVEEQNGFRKGRSCQDHIFSLHSIIHCRKILRQDTYALFIDFRKAFDSVNRELLWNKLQQKFGIQGSFLTLLKGLYNHVRSCVRVNGELTEWFDINSGVKQGCILSPILFSMFINDLVTEINSLGKGVDITGDKASSLLYADDLVIFASNERDLQCMLDKIDAWCTKWGVAINPRKTKAIHFRSRNKPLSSFTFSCGSHNLEFCHEYKYLGYWINEFLDIGDSLQKVFNRANQALGLIIAKSKAIGGFPFAVFSKLYDVSVISIFSYIAHLWAFTSSPLAVKVQNNALRFFFGLGKAAPTAALLGDSGWPPIQLQLQFVLLKYWYKVSSMDNERLPKKIFCWAKELASKGKKSWCFKVNKLMSELDSSKISFASTNKYYDSLWCVLAEKFLASWRRAVSGGSDGAATGGGKLSVYRVIKSQPLVEPYVRSELSVGVRRVMAGLRAGCLPLQVELGRYTLPKTPFEQRTCRLCNTEVENQEHLLTRCSHLSKPRKLLYNFLAKYNSDFTYYNDSKKCLTILQPSSGVYSICKLVYDMFTLRNDILYSL